jgi:lysophospholipase L1-like esterase
VVIGESISLLLIVSGVLGIDQGRHGAVDTKGLVAAFPAQFRLNSQAIQKAFPALLQSSPEATGVYYDFDYDPVLGFRDPTFFSDPTYVEQYGGDLIDNRVGAYGTIELLEVYKQYNIIKTHNFVRHTHTFLGVPQQLGPLDLRDPKIDYSRFAIRDNIDAIKAEIDRRVTISQRFRDVTIIETYRGYNIVKLTDVPDRGDLMAGVPQSLGPLDLADPSLDMSNIIVRDAISSLKAAIDLFGGHLKSDVVDTRRLYNDARISIYQNGGDLVAVPRDVVFADFTDPGFNRSRLWVAGGVCVSKPGHHGRHCAQMTVDAFRSQALNRLPNSSTMVHQVFLESHGKNRIFLLNESAYAVPSYLGFVDLTDPIQREQPGVLSEPAPCPAESNPVASPCLSAALKKLRQRIDAAQATRKPFVIVTFGGSTTAGVSPSKNWPAYLVWHARARGVREDIIVINAGHNGYTTFTNAIWFANWIIPLLDRNKVSPNLILSLDGVNDLMFGLLGYLEAIQTNAPHWFSYYHAYHQELYGDITQLQSFRKALENLTNSLRRVHLFNVVMTKVVSVIPYSAAVIVSTMERVDQSDSDRFAKMIKSKNKGGPPTIEISLETIQTVLQAFQSHLADFCGLATIRGIPLVAFLQPVMLSEYYSYPSYPDDVDYPSIEYIGRHLIDQGLHARLGHEFLIPASEIYRGARSTYGRLNKILPCGFTDLSGAFLDARRNMYARDSIHYNFEGSDRIASAMIEDLIARGILHH